MQETTTYRLVHDPTAHDTAGTQHRCIDHHREDNHYNLANVACNVLWPPYSFAFNRQSQFASSKGHFLIGRRSKQPSVIFFTLKREQQLIKKVFTLRERRLLYQRQEKPCEVLQFLIPCPFCDELVMKGDDCPSWRGSVVELKTWLNNGITLKQLIA